MKTKKKTVNIEFYMLFDDQTWGTTFIDIPKSVYDLSSHEKMVEWAQANERFADNVELIGVYCDEPYEDE